MKKLYSLLFCLSLLCSFCISSYAVSKTYALDANGLSMTIDIPDHYVVYTDNLGFDKERVKEFGEMGEMVLDSETAGLILEAWDEGTRTEIAVTCVDSALGDYNQFSDTTLLGLSSAFQSVMKQMGGEVSSSVVYQGAQAKFLKYVSKIPHDNGQDGFDYMIQYNTAYSNKTVNITLHSYNGEPSDETAAELEEVVRSSRFGANPASAPEAEQTSSFVYTDEERGVSFTVPANWKEEPLNKEREVLKAKFASTQEQGLSVMYGWLDFYPMVEELGLSAGYPRETVNQDFFTVEDMNLLFSAIYENAESGNEVSDFTDISYGGIHYFKGTQKGSATIYGLNMSNSMIVLYHFDHGYLYEFLFPGSEDSPYYEDFVQLVSSAVFTTALNNDASEKEIYYDAVTGISFAIPDGWFLYEENAETGATKFKPERDKSNTVAFTRSDFWGILTEQERQGISREEFRWDDIPEEIRDLATFGHTEYEIVVFQSGEYVQYVFPFGVNAGSLNAEFNMTELFRIENGYLFVFQFSGDATSAFYDDFSQIVNSIDYTTLKEPLETVISNENINKVLPGNLRFGMSQKEVHDLFGSPMSSYSEFAELTDVYRVDYNLRPVGYDLNENWKGTAENISLEIDYKSTNSGYETIAFLFGFTNTSVDEAYIDTVLEYLDYLYDKYGEPVDQKENDNQVVFVFDDGQYYTYFSLTFDDDSVYFYNLVQTVESLKENAAAAGAASITEFDLEAIYENMNDPKLYGISKIGYFDQLQVLAIVLSNDPSKMIVYYDVPKNVYEDILNGYENGTTSYAYYWQYIVGNYQSENYTIS